MAIMRQRRLSGLVLLFISALIAMAHVYLLFAEIMGQYIENFNLSVLHVLSFHLLGLAMMLQLVLYFTEDTQCETQFILSFGSVSVLNYISAFILRTFFENALTDTLFLILLCALRILLGVGVSLYGAKIYKKQKIRQPLIRKISLEELEREQ